MHLLNVFYYNYFLFYKKVIKDTEPHFATVLGLSFNLGLLVNGTIDILSRKLFCYRFDVWVQVAIVVLIICSNYQVYHHKGRAQEITTQKPIIANNRGLSIAVTWLFFLITSSWLFWGSIYGKYLLSQCR